MQAKTISVLRKNAVRTMQQTALDMRDQYLSYAEDMRLFAKPEFWSAIEEIETGKAKKMDLKELKKQLGL